MNERPSSEDPRGRPEKKPANAPKRPEVVEQPPAPEIGDVSGDHEGATDDEVGDRRGPGAGYDQEPEQQRQKGGVS